LPRGGEELQLRLLPRIVASKKAIHLSFSSDVRGLQVFQAAAPLVELRLQTRTFSCASSNPAAPLLQQAPPPAPSGLAADIQESSLRFLLQGQSRGV